MTSIDTGRASKVIGPGDVVGDLYGRSDERAPIVLIHGLSFDRRIWDPVLTELATVDRGRHLLAIDLPGHGESGDPWRWALDLAVDSLRAVVAEQGMTEPVLVGHSAGAVLANAYAGRFPTSGVVNVDAHLQIAGFASLLKSIEPMLRGPGFADAWRGIATSFGTEQLPDGPRQVVESYGPPRQEVALGFWHDLLTLPLEENAVAWDRMFVDMRLIGAPYHIVSASPLAPDYERWLHERLPDATWELFSGGGHFPMLADPARFAAILAGTGKWHRDLRRWTAVAV